MIGHNPHALRNRHGSTINERALPVDATWLIAAAALVKRAAALSPAERAAAIRCGQARPTQLLPRERAAALSPDERAAAFDAAGLIAAAALVN